MKKTAIALAVGTCLASPAMAGFINGGFEDGNINGWTAGGGTGVASRTSVSNSTITPAQWLPGGTHYNAANNHSSIIAAGAVDPNLGALLGSTVYSGNYSYRVEDTTNGGFASAISQKVTNYTDANIFFAWKAVLENGGHLANSSALMQIVLHDDTTNTNIITRIYNAGAGGGGVDTRFSSQGNLFYTSAWQIEQLAIDPSLFGHDFTLSVLAADCQPAGHTGYVYLDGFGAVAPPSDVPEPESLALLGLGLAGLVVARRRKRA